MNRRMEKLQDEREDLKLSDDEEREIDDLIENKIDDIKLNTHYKNKLTKKEKIELLKTFLGDEIYFKSMKDTLTETELIKYIDKNLDIMVEKVGVKTIV